MRISDWSSDVCSSDLEDPRISTKNPMFQEIDQPGVGRFLASGSMLDFGAAPRTAVRPAPVLGQHTDEVLTTVLGLGDGEIGRLHDAGIVGGPSGAVREG